MLALRKIALDHKWTSPFNFERRDDSFNNLRAAMLSLFLSFLVASANVLLMETAIETLFVGEENEASVESLLQYTTATNQPYNTTNIVRRTNTYRIIIILVINK